MKQMMSITSYSVLKSFVSLFKFTKVSQRQGENVDTFYNRILKLAHQCDFSDMNERLIDAIIFGMTCVKAQGKLLQNTQYS